MPPSPGSQKCLKNIKPKGWASSLTRKIFVRDAPPEKLGVGAKFAPHGAQNRQKCLKNKVFAPKWLKSEEKVRGSKYLPPSLASKMPPFKGGHSILARNVFPSFALSNQTKIFEIGWKLSYSFIKNMVN